MSFLNSLIPLNHALNTIDSEVDLFQAMRENLNILFRLIYMNSYQ
jgi:hypothetical protein